MPMTARPSPRARSLIELFDEAALIAQYSGEHANHALLNELVVAARELRQRTAAAQGQFDGVVAYQINRLHELL